MEDQKKQIVHGECPRKLNLSVPLLSTKRHLTVATDNSLAASVDNTHRVPFSWEQLPGQPKDRDRNASYLDLDFPPTPKLPPGRRYEPKDCIADQYSEYDDGCYGDDDSGDQEERDERFSDAIDIFSLAESVDYAETNFKVKKERSEANACHSPNFIIERFLPDAQALAAESINANNRHPFSTSSESGASFPRKADSIGRSYTSPKGCGMGSLFPWKMKPKLCSVKTPVCDTIIGANHKKTTDSTS